MERKLFSCSKWLMLTIFTTLLNHAVSQDCGYVYYPNRTLNREAKYIQDLGIISVTDADGVGGCRQACCDWFGECNVALYDGSLISGDNCQLFKCKSTDMKKCLGEEVTGMTFCVISRDSEPTTQVPVTSTDPTTKVPITSTDLITKVPVTQTILKPTTGGRTNETTFTTSGTMRPSQLPLPPMESSTEWSATVTPNSMIEDAKLTAVHLKITTEITPMSDVTSSKQQLETEDAIYIGTTESLRTTNSLTITHVRHSTAQESTTPSETTHINVNTTSTNITISPLTKTRNVPTTLPTQAYRTHENQINATNSTETSTKITIPIQAIATKRMNTSEPTITITEFAKNKSINFNETPIETTIRTNITTLEDTNTPSENFNKEKTELNEIEKVGGGMLRMIKIENALEEQLKEKTSNKEISTEEASIEEASTENVAETRILHSNITILSNSSQVNTTGYFIPSSERNSKYMVSGALISVITFGLIFFVMVAGFVGKKVYLSWSRRHYSQEDYFGLYD